MNVDRQESSLDSRKIRVKCSFKYVCFFFLIVSDDFVMLGS